MSRGAGFDLGDVVLEWPVPAGALISRVHWSSEKPVEFGHSRSRTFGGLFDPPPGDFAVIYAAERLAGAFVETLLQRRERILARAFVEAHWWSLLTASRPLRLLKAFGDGLSLYGLKPWSDLEHARAQSHALAEAVYAHRELFDGIAYHARQDSGEICYAVFERGETPALLQVQRSTPLDQARSEVDGLMRRYGGVWDLSPPVRLT